MSDDSQKLTQDEFEAIQLWSAGRTMTDAYCEVMRRKEDVDSLPKQTLNKRVQRFFGTDRMKKMMATNNEYREKAIVRQKTMDVYGPVVQKIKPKIQQAVQVEEKTETKKREKHGAIIDKKKNTLTSIIDNVVIPNASNENGGVSAFQSRVDEVTQTNEMPVLNVADKSARQKWLDSLTITDQPEAISVYGTGQFIMYHAVSEMMKRDRAIKEHRRETGIFDKNGSVFTPMILNAFKVAASMIIPFTQTQLGDQQREVSMASALLQLSMDNINVDPDAYTAPIPPTANVQQEPIDITSENTSDENKD